MLFTRALEKICLENTNILKIFLEDLLKVSITKIEKSNSEFGYRYSKPFLFLDIELVDGKSIFLAIQDIFEPIMRKETIAYFLVKEFKKQYNRFILVNINLFDKCQTSSNAIDFAVELDREILNLNTLRVNDNDSSFVNEFIKFLNESDNPCFLESTFSEIRNLKIEYEKIKYTFDRCYISDIEKGIIDRISTMGDKDRINNILYLRAIELFIGFNLNKDFVLHLFNEIPNDQLSEMLDIHMQKYCSILKMFNNNFDEKTVNQILQPHPLIMQLALSSKQKH